MLVTNVHEEASEEDLRERFEEFGDIQNLRVTLDKRTGYVKVYKYLGICYCWGSSKTMLTTWYFFTIGLRIYRILYPCRGPQSNHPNKQHKTP